VYDVVESDDDLAREFGKWDRYYLFTRILARKDGWHPWLLARCREVENAPDGHLDLWSRGHYKSSLITYAGIIQEILRDPDITVGLFSHTRPIAKAFLKQIKREFEANETLKRIYPDICYQQPHKESPQWSEDGGIVVKRKSNPKEATVEAWGLIDGQPTSKHYALRVYDDVVTRESVTTPEQVRKTTEALDLSQNLGPMNKVGREWYIGTRYSYADTYQTMIERKQVILRVYPATDDGTKTGKPVFMAVDAWESLLKKSSDYSIACQQLQNPTAGTAAMFDKAWLRVAEVRPETLNVYIMVDPASSKKATSDRTAMAVIGIDCNENKFLIDGACHRMNLAERWDMLKSLRRRWFNMPGVQSVHVGYEKYGMQSDLEFFEQEQMRDGRSFDIKELGWTRDGTGSKSDRVQRLIPDFKCERFYLPARHDKPTSVQQRMIDAGRKHLVMNDIRKKDEEGRVYSVVERFIEEYAFFPFSSHDDMIDAVSRIYDMEYNIPMIVREESLEPEYV
jgi:hypothetical protein